MALGHPLGSTGMWGGYYEDENNVKKYVDTNWIQVLN
jgi:hypothetical protein